MTTDEIRASYPVVLRAPDLDWIKFDAELARNGDVEPVAKALYAALASFADTAERDTAQDPDDEDVPTRRRLAACIGKSVDTVDRSVKRLEEYGLLEVERRKDPNNPRSNIPSIYRLLDRERWDERAGERAAKRRAEREKKRAAKEAKEKAEREAAEREAAKQQAEATDSDTNTPEEGWPHTCGQGGRTHAARVAAHMRPGWPHTCGGTSPLGEESSSSSDDTSETPAPRMSVEEEEDVPSARTNPAVDPVLDDVIARTDATAEEAEAVIESIEDHAQRHNIDIGSIGRYVTGFGDRDLTRHLKRVRAQRAPEARTRASGATGPDRTCQKHHVPLDCPVCASLPLETVRTFLAEYGPARRPDLAARIGGHAPTPA